jgi:hypothetical protein
MGLPVSQQRSLDRIESALRDSDPRLAALFMIFSRLNRDEEMPRMEQLKAGLAWLRLWLRTRPALARRWLRTSWRGLRTSGRRKLRTALFFPAALAVVVCSFWLGGTYSSGARCTSVPRTAGITQLIANGKTKAKPRVRPRIRAKSAKASPAAACPPVIWPVAR